MGYYSEGFWFSVKFNPFILTAKYNIAYEESARAREIDDVILVLVASVSRVEVMASDPRSELVHQMENIRYSGVELLSAVVDYLTQAIAHFKQGFLSICHFTAVVDLILSEDSARRFSLDRLNSKI